MIADRVRVLKSVRGRVIPQIVHIQRCQQFLFATYLDFTPKHTHAYHYKYEYRCLYFSQQNRVYGHCATHTKQSSFCGDFQDRFVGSRQVYFTYHK